MVNTRLTKNFEYEVKDVDIPGGVVDIYVNAYGNKDSDGDISAEGSFTKTIKENFKRIKHLYNHNKNIFLGLPIEFPTDYTGLLVRSDINKEKEIGKDVLSDYRFCKDRGRTLEHSIGYEVIKRDERNKSIITEYRLFEYSTLSFLGANENTPLVDMKSLKTAEDYFQRIQDLTDMYNTSYSDNRLKQIEVALKSLTNAKPDQLQDTTLIIEPNNDAEILQSLKSITTTLKAL